MAMNYRELAGAVRKEHGFSKALSGRIVDTVIESIRDEVKRGGMVRLRNFGTFRARVRYGKRRAEFDDSENFFREGR